jgi:hypothetical protein
MADVEMADAGQPSTETKVATKASKGPAAGTEGGEKKKFEVKKVRWCGNCHAGVLTNVLDSGTPLLYGLGILLSTTVLSAEITLWISALSARPTRVLLPLKSALLPGASVM